MPDLLHVELEIVEILLVVSLVAVAARRFQLPYTIALVLAGLALTVQNALRLELTPELVLALFLPPLLFEAAFHIQFQELREDLAHIAILAIPGLLVGAALTGGLLFAAGVLALPQALLFGTLISATDPVAVVATFKAMGAPRRLTTLLEGESLFNDGTAIVAFQIILGLALAGTLDPLQGVVDFLRVGLGGLAVGAVLGYATSWLIARIDDYLIETTLTTILAFGSYLLAERFHVSGVLAVVMAGLMSGNLGPRGMSPTTHIVLFNFWEYIAFLANSFVFLLLGMSVDLEELKVYLRPVLLAVAIVLFSRAVVIYGLGLVIRLLRRPVSLAYLHVLVWGGLRGAVSLALVLSLPFGLAGRRQLLAMAFGVVLFTLLAQATTLPLLLRRLGFAGEQRLPAEYERLQGELLAVRAARRHVGHLHREGALLPHAWETVERELQEREQAAVAAMDSLLQEHPELQAQIIGLAREEALRAERAALAAMAREGLLSNETLDELLAEVDSALQKAKADQPSAEAAAAEKHSPEERPAS